MLWGNRGMISRHGQAQRHYLEGEFGAAVGLLEGARAGKIDARSLTLLVIRTASSGGSARARGFCQKCRKAPDLDFPRYGFGRTLLAKGDYAGAVEAIRQAVAQGAPTVVRLDLGEAYYRFGSTKR